MEDDKRCAARSDPGGGRAAIANGDQERMLDAILNATTDHIYVIDRERRIVCASRSGAAAMGIAPEKLVGKTGEEIGLPPDAVARLRQEIAQVFDSGRPLSGEMTLPTLQGPHEFTYTWSPMPGPDGGIKYLLFSARDIEERKVAEHALRRSEEQYRSFVDTTSEGVWAVDGAFRTAFVNGRMAAMLGYTQAEMLGRPILDFVFPEDRARMEERFAERRAGRSGHYDHRYLCKNGAELWVLAATAPRLDNEGRFVGAIGMFTDITDRKRTEEALYESEARLQMAMEAAHAGTWEIDIATRRGYFSDSMGPILGRPRGFQEARAAAWQAFIHPDDLPSVRAHFRRARRGRAPFDVEHRVVWPDGKTVRWVVTRGKVVRGHAGRPLRALGVTHDVSERRHTEDEIRRLNMDLERRVSEVELLNVQLRRGINETHHRIKNNLQIITALINIETMRHETAVPLQNIRLISQHVQTLAMIHSLLTQHANVHGVVQYVSVGALMEQLLPALHAMVRGRAIHHSVMDVHLSVRQTSALAVLINELVSNSVKYAYGAIRIRFAAHDGIARLEVEDDGPGFGPDFDPHTSAYTGLELIRSLVQWDLGGTVGFESRPHGGARVAVEFPLPENRPILQ